MFMGDSKEWFFAMSRDHVGKSWFDHHHHDREEESMQEKSENYFSENLCNSNIIIISLFLYVVLVIGSLTARRRRLSTFFIGTLMLYTAFVLVFTLHDSDWYSGMIDPLISSYSRFTDAIHPAKYDVRFGLKQFVIYYYTDDDDAMEFSYDERFDWDISKPNQHLKELKEESLHRGLPNSILILLDYLSMNEGSGFSWGKRLTYAGYYAFCTLIWSWVSYIISLILLIVTPKHGIQCLSITGLLLITSVVVFRYNIPELNLPNFCVVIEGTKLPLNFGKSYYLILTTGVLNLFSSVLMLTLIRFNYVQTISTYFEINFDTPWDNRKIREESADAALSARQQISNKFRKSYRNFHTSFNIKIGKRFRAAAQFQNPDEIINLNLSTSTTESNNNINNVNIDGVKSEPQVTFDNEITSCTRL